MRHLEDAKLAANKNQDPYFNANNPNAPYGEIFLGRDEKTFGADGTGWVDYDPGIECGGPSGTSGRQCPHKLRGEDDMGLDLGGDEGRRLHVAIASYRDPLCPVTLFNLFAKAARPDSVRIRVLQQNDPELDPDCLDGYCKLMSKDKSGTGPMKTDHAHCPHADQIFIHKIHAKEAAGPTHARGLLSADIAAANANGEVKAQDFCLSIDSHMDFESDWDHKMIEMWDLADNEYAVLSTHVASTDQLGVNLNEAHEVPHLCMVTFTSSVRTHATKVARNLSKPKLTNAIWGAGLSFSKCHAELKVPVDPHTPHIFDGEEFNRAARFFTYGYDIYTPNRVYILHDYERSQHNPVTASWQKNAGDRTTIAASHARLKTMIGVPGGEADEAKALRLRKTKYGLGDRRSLEELIEFSGIDLFHGKFPLDGINRCGNIKWVPFAEHPKGVNYIPRFDEMTEDPLDPPDKTSVWYDPGMEVHGVADAFDSKPKFDGEEADRGSGNAFEEGGSGSPVGRDAEVHGAPEHLNELHAKLEQEIQAAEAEDGEDDDEDVEPKGRDEIAHDVHKNLHKHHAELRQTMEKAEEEEASAEAHAAHPETVEDTEMLSSDSRDVKAPIIRDHDAAAVGRAVNYGGKTTRGGHQVIPNEEHKPPIRGGHPEGLLRNSARPATRAGLPQLPLLVQITSMFLVFGVAVSIFMAKGTGVGRKRRLARSKRIL